MDLPDGQTESILNSATPCGEVFRGCHSARCPRSRARLLLDCSDSAQEYGHPEQEKMRAEVRGHGRVVMKSIDSAAILITY